MQSLPMITIMVNVTDRIAVTVTVTVTDTVTVTITDTVTDPKLLKPPPTWVCSLVQA